VPTHGTAELVMYIGDQAFVTAEPAYRAAHALAHGQSFDGEFDALTQQMRTEKLVGESWNYAPDRCLTRGDVAFMVCRACRIQTGLNWLLTGLGRYAWRELQFKGIAGDGSDAAYMSGGEFVGLLSRAEEYLSRAGKRAQPPVELGARPGSPR
jgi:hypothetical protein